MAAGGTSWHQYYNSAPKHHMPPPNSQAAFGSAGGDMQDMHLKMSKKIAQLTKVIYALNTKNDEHEAALLAMKEAHEEEAQQLLGETAVKIQHYRLKIGNELDLRKRLQNLEEIVNVAEREKRQAMIEFESFKRLVEEREMRLESDHALKVMSLTKDLVDSKAEFEKRMREFHDLKAAMRNEGGAEIEKLTNEHRKELERLHVTIDKKDATFNEEKRDMVELHTKQLHAMEREISNLKTEFKKMEEDYETKMSKAKSFYERELAAVQNRSSATDEEAMKRWQEREAGLREEASKMEYSLKKKLSGLTDELRVQTLDSEEIRKRLEDSNAQMKNLEEKNSDLADCITKAQKQYSAASIQLQHAKSELEAVHARLQRQESDILKKSSLIGTLEAAKLMHEATIQDLEKEIQKLKAEMENLSMEKKSLQNNSSEQSQQLTEQLQAMSKRLESVIEEKSRLKDQLPKELERLKQSHSGEMKELAERFESERQVTERNHQSVVETMKAEARNAMDGLLRDMQDRLRKETTELIEEKNEAVNKVETEKKELHQKLQSTQNELSRLENLVRQHEDGLGDAGSHINSLKSRIQELQRELEMSDGRLRTSETSMAAFRKEMESAKVSYEHDIDSSQRKHQNEIERLSTQLNSKWQDQLRSEVSELQRRLTDQHTNDKRIALEQLQTQKEREMEAAKTGWQEQIKQLSSLKSELKSAMEQQQKDSDRMLAEERATFAQAERDLRQAASDAAHEYSSKIASMEIAHRSEVVTCENKKEQELRALEGKLMSQHREEQQNQIQAHRLTIEAMKEKLGREHQEELMRREQQNLQNMEQIRADLVHRHASDLDQAARHHEQRLASVRSELESAVLVSRRLEAEYSRKIGGLEEDLGQKTMLLNALERKVRQQGEEVVSLNKEIDCKGQEILRIRSEANTELRRREDDLTRKFQREQDQTEAENLRQKQTLVGEFNRATESLKDKISAMNIAIQEAEDRYERRESRPEDLHTIRELKQIVHDKEAQMQKLIDDKKYYQLELVNRETNFNKVFSAAPNVGVLNPLNAQKKKADKAAPGGRFASQFVAVPNMSTIESALSAPNRLGPIKPGPSSPGASSSSSFSKNLQPTPPPPRPKKFIRMKREELPEEYRNIPKAGKSDDALYIEEDLFHHDGSMSRYMPDDFEGSLKEFDKECEMIESRSSLSSSCQSLNSIEGCKSPIRNVSLDRSATLPRNASLSRRFIPARPNSSVDDEKSFSPVIDDIIDDIWTKNEAQSKRFRSSYSSSLPNPYQSVSTNYKNYASSSFELP